MPRALDHLVLPTPDLAGLAALYRRLGFTVGRENRHPWGTLNHIIQFRRNFLELIGFAPDYTDLKPTDPAFPFAGFVSRTVAESRGGGIAMAVLRSSDAEADATQFQSSGIGGRLLPFSRSARGPQGEDRTVAFTVAFAEAPTMPDIGFFTCQQHRPENFWNPTAQTHANGVTDLTGLVIVAENPSEHAEFLAHFTGQREMLATSMGLDVETAGSRFEVLTPVAFGFRYGADALRYEGRPCIAAANFQVEALSATAAFLRTAGYALHEVHRSLVVGPEAGTGCALVFADRR